MACAAASCWWLAVAWPMRAPAKAGLPAASNRIILFLHRRNLSHGISQQSHHRRQPGPRPRERTFPAATAWPTSPSPPPTSGRTSRCVRNAREATEWHRVVFNGRLAEIVERVPAQGPLVYVEGSLRTRSGPTRAAWRNTAPKSGPTRCRCSAAAGHGPTGRRRRRGFDSAPRRPAPASPPGARFRARAATPGQGVQRLRRHGRRYSVLTGIPTAPTDANLHRLGAGGFGLDKYMGVYILRQVDFKETSHASCLRPRPSFIAAGLHGAGAGFLPRPSGGGR